MGKVENKMNEGVRLSCNFGPTFFSAICNFIPWHQKPKADQNSSVKRVPGINGNTLGSGPITPKLINAISAAEV